MGEQRNPANIPQKSQSDPKTYYECQFLEIWLSWSNLFIQFFQQASGLRLVTLEIQTEQWFLLRELLLQHVGQTLHIWQHSRAVGHLPPETPYPSESGHSLQNQHGYPAIRGNLFRDHKHHAEPSQPPNPPSRPPNSHTASPPPSQPKTAATTPIPTSAPVGKTNARVLTAAKMPSSSAAWDPAQTSLSAWQTAWEAG